MTTNPIKLFFLISFYLAYTNIYDFSKNLNLSNKGEFTASYAAEIGSYNDPVWPGDFNKDGVANNLDLLYWGRAFGEETGPIRLNASNEWIAQEGLDWHTSINGINKKHQDGNGNGLIDLLDIEVLQKNYGQVHDTSSIGYPTKNIAFKLESKTHHSDIKHIYPLSIESQGNPVSLHGFSCTFDLGDMLIDTVYFDITNSSLEPTQVLQVFDPLTNTLDIALTRTDKVNKVCEKPLGEFIIIMDNLAVFQSREYMPVQVKNGGQMIASGEFNAIASTTIDNSPSLKSSSSDLLPTASAGLNSQYMGGSANVDTNGGSLLAPSIHPLLLYPNPQKYQHFKRS